MNILKEIWFWFLVLGLILTFFGTLLWGIRGKAGFWVWFLIGWGDVSLIAAFFILNKERFL
uniref:Transmembrane protein n=1 Tax=Pithovirus LCPAC202 TaxID=2506592 RepID=A0A481Z911_9VIRU|nr:MAG: uncharacterized protein LCPAC202_01350 [Pithovirus LCPAC202]